MPQNVAPSRYGRIIAPGQQVIPDEVVVTMEPDAPVPPDVQKTGPRTGVYRVRAGESIEAAVARLQQRPGIAAAGANVVFKAADEAGDVAPNDPLLSRQWYLSTIGASKAWARAKGEAVTVAVLDSGIDAGHPEFAGRLVGGISFVGGSAGPADDYGHGTHVAGLVGALANNGVGIAGVAPNVKIMPIKVLDRNGMGTLDSVLSGIEAARDAGARVINMSLASPISSSAQDYAIAECVKAGMIVVAAAGNEGTDSPSFPAGSPGVIAVGSTSTSDRRSSFSNGGSHVRIVAPGEDIASTYPRESGSYVMKNGTSMATPIVAGVIAAMLSAKPTLKSAEVASILYQTGAPSTGFSGARRVDFAAAMAAVAPAPVVSKPDPTPAPVTPVAPVAPVVKPSPVTVAPTPAPVAKPIATPRPTPTPRPEGQLPSWGYVNWDEDTTTAQPQPGATAAPVKEGLRNWGYVGFDGSTSTPAPGTQAPPSSDDKPLRNWGYVTF